MLKYLLLIVFLSALYRVVSSLFGVRVSSNMARESAGDEMPSITTDVNHFNRVGGPQHDSMDTQLIDL